MRRDYVIQLCVLAGLGLSTIPARADDFAPPSWRLSNSSATVQEWDFNTATVPLAPDGSIWGSGGSGFVNANGTPQLSSVGTATWSGALGSRFGMYNFAGPTQVLDFQIPNSVNPGNQKDIWIQLTFFAAGTVLQPDVNYSASSGSGAASLVSSAFGADGWTHAVYSVNLASQPASETISLVNNTPVVMQLDQIVVDTVCTPVPEPASLTCLGLGALAVIRRKRLKK